MTPIGTEYVVFPQLDRGTDGIPRFLSLTIAILILDLIRFLCI